MTELVAALLLAACVVGALYLAQSPLLAVVVVAVLVLASVTWLAFTGLLRWRAYLLREAIRQRAMRDGSGTGMSVRDDLDGPTDAEEQFHEYVGRERSRWQREGRLR